jgi:hypothetical protein
LPCLSNSFFVVDFITRRPMGVVYMYGTRAVVFIEYLKNTVISINMKLIDVYFSSFLSPYHVELMFSSAFS